jgi:ABC-type proline/glycine betaine transport system permease subunit
MAIYLLAALSCASAFSAQNVWQTHGGSSRQGYRSSPLGPFSSSSSTARTAESSSNRQVVGDWEELHGNFLLRPSIEAGPPRALIHFLGGAIVGASPHISYRYMLERLAEKGFLVIATPYDLSFDHLSTCDAVITKFERIAALLAQTYGALPVVGVGHSCGALLQLLITSLFPDTPRAANALISYNNKPVSDAVPFFGEFFAPFFTYAAARNDPNRHSGSQVISVGLQLAKAATIGQVPSDELLSEAAKLLVPPSVANSMGSQPISVSAQMRELFQSFAAPVTTALAESGFTPIVSETFDALQQIPKLIDEVADGARDFDPSPTLVKSMTRKGTLMETSLCIWERWFCHL